MLAVVAASQRSHRVDAAALTFDPLKFFVGSTEGEGTLKVLLTPARHTRVQGTGRLLSDGTLVLTQVVAIETKPTRKREWRLRLQSPGRYAGPCPTRAVQSEVRSSVNDFTCNIR